MAREWIRFYVFVCVWSAPVQAYRLAKGFADQRHMAEMAWQGHMLVAVIGLLSFVATLTMLEHDKRNRA